jgi:archaellum biogenesis protein FlaJ (TadC family)
MLWKNQHVVKTPIRHVQDLIKKWHGSFSAECQVHQIRCLYDLLTTLLLRQASVRRGIRLFSYADRG